MKKNLLAVILLVPLAVFSQEYNNAPFPSNKMETLNFANKSREEVKTLLDQKVNSTDFWEGVFRIDSFAIYGGGQLFDITAGKLKEGSTPTGGSLGVSAMTPNLVYNFHFTYNSKDTQEVNTLKDLGTTIMRAHSGGHSLNASFIYRPSYKFRSRIGIQGTLSLSDQILKMDSMTVFDASPLTARIGLILIPLEANFQNANLRTSLSLLYTHRNILGEFNNSAHIIEGTAINRRGYNGFDLIVKQRIDQVGFSAQLSFNPKPKFGDNSRVSLPSFTGTQVQIGMSVSGLLKMHKRN